MAETRGDPGDHSREPGGGGKRRDRLREDHSGQNPQPQSLSPQALFCPSWEQLPILIKCLFEMYSVETAKNHNIAQKSGIFSCFPSQVPQFLLDDAIGSGCGLSCHVICTQPRRISAISGAITIATTNGDVPLIIASSFQQLPKEWLTRGENGLDSR